MPDQPSGHQPIISREGTSYAVTTFYVPISCSECGLTFTVPVGFHNQRRHDGEGFYCPNGHEMSYISDEEMNRKGDAHKRCDLLQVHQVEQAEAKLADLNRQIATSRSVLNGESTAAEPMPQAGEAFEWRTTNWGANTGVCKICEAKELKKWYRQPAGLIAHLFEKHGIVKTIPECMPTTSDASPA